MPNEFLHCNACFTYLTSSTAQETQIRFWLTECGHVICLLCLKKHGNTSQKNSSTTTENVCPMCNAKCSAVELTDQLPPNLNMFFRPAYEIMDETADVLKFQQTNTFALLRFLKDKVAKQKQLLDKAKDELLQFKDTKNQLQAIKKENQRLKAQIQDIRTSLAANETTESPSKLNSRNNLGTRLYSPSIRTPRKLSGDRHSNYASPNQACKPRTPNPPTRLSLPDSSSPVQHSYYNNNGSGFISDNQSLWSRGDRNYRFDDGPNHLSHDRSSIGKSPTKSYSTFVDDDYEKYTQRSRLQSFPRPGTISSARVSWSQLHGDTGNITRLGLRPGLRSKPFY
ncbi:RING finger protein [Gigaspora margarita]|uniref:RING finger protein n=1 Tax=Gigaspora margarita TaxID=4874 RepID=A0A8H3X636_GIGMA|nr:RING finger protein [Gigaspora margarita]